MVHFPLFLSQFVHNNSHSFSLLPCTRNSKTGKADSRSLGPSMKTEHGRNNCSQTNKNSAECWVMEEQIPTARDVAHWSPCSWPQGLGFHHQERKERKRMRMRRRHWALKRLTYQTLSWTWFYKITHWVRRESPDTQSMIKLDVTEWSSDWV